MSIFQCQRCGSSENTALGLYHSRHRNERYFDGLENGTALCSACAPTHYKDGSCSSFNGEWHNRFTRHFLPKGCCFTNNEGNLEHRETGLVGNKLYETLGKVEEYPD